MSRLGGKGPISIDVRVLVQHFLGAGVTMDQRTLERFVGHPWPGNVRELRNAVERWKAGAEPLTASPSAPGAAVTASLDESKGNVSEAARRAGVSRMAVVKMFTRLGLLG